MPSFNPKKFEISSTDYERLDALYEKFLSSAERHLGYPANTVYGYADLYRFFEFTINNVGDPFEKGIYQINTHEFEREVLSFFAKLFHISRDEHWGYVTNGGTESNMHALYLARNTLPEGVVYFSEHAHYSVKKTVKILNAPHMRVDSQENGEMDYRDLEKKLHTIPKKPPIIVATIGTTMRGAVDEAQDILEVVERCKIKDFYIHCDAAFGGMILPFIDDAPVFDFRLPVNSISISGHKMIGIPVPCGILIARKKYADLAYKHIEIIGASDTTLSGSRDGHAPLFFWYAIRRFGMKGFRQMIAQSLEVKTYALESLGKFGWPAETTPFSLTLVIKRPPEKLVEKWQLAVQEDIAHLVIMPNITKKHVDAFMNDLRAEQKNYRDAAK